MIYLGENFPELVETRDFYGNTALLVAAEVGSLSTVKILLNKFKFDIHEKTKTPSFDCGRTCFHSAAFSQYGAWKYLWNGYRGSRSEVLQFVEN